MRKVILVAFSTRQSVVYSWESLAQTREVPINSHRRHSNCLDIHIHSYVWQRERNRELLCTSDNMILGHSRFLCNSECLVISGETSFKYVGWNHCWQQSSSGRGTNYRGRPWDDRRLWESGIFINVLGTRPERLFHGKIIKLEPIGLSLTITN